LLTILVTLASTIDPAYSSHFKPNVIVNIRLCSTYLLGKPIYKYDEPNWQSYGANDITPTIGSTGAVSFKHPRPTSPVENGVLQLQSNLAAENTLSIL
ncbi:hypothetical protein ANCCAN_08207, partial [Ancylostoma caninum]